MHLIKNLCIHTCIHTYTGISLSIDIVSKTEEYILYNVILLIQYKIRTFYSVFVAKHRNISFLSVVLYICIIITYICMYIDKIIVYIIFSISSYIM